MRLGATEGIDWGGERVHRTNDDLYTAAVARSITYK